MKTADRKRIILTLVIQAFILVSTVIIASSGILFGASSSQDGDNMVGLGYFKAFTMDSNILAGISALIIVCFAIGNLRKRECEIPAWVSFFQLMTATSLFLTMVTVIFFLAPSDVMEGKSYWGMFSEDLFFFHLVNPLLSILSFVFLQRNYRWKRKECIWGVVPMAIYTVVYFLMVIVLKKWRDFYGFTFGGRYYLIPVVIIVMFLLTYFLGYLLVWLNEKTSR